MAVAILGGRDNRSSTRVLTVDDLRGDPFSFKGRITVRGVVAAKSRAFPEIFGMIDTREVLLCKQTGCAQFYLPVSFQGRLPHDWDEVKVSGTIVSSQKPFPFVFLADKIVRLRRIKI